MDARGAAPDEPVSDADGDATPTDPPPGADDAIERADRSEATIEPEAAASDGADLADDITVAAAVVGGAGETPGPDVPADVGVASAPAARVGRGPRLLAGIRAAARMPRSRRGLFALLLVGGALGAVTVFAGVTMIQWTETADFCGRCHAMAPELIGYELGAHSEVSCAECHVEPGVAGWVKSKINGTRQLAEVILGSFPEPIPPPDHDMLPSVEDTCLKCHEVGRLAPANLRTRTTYAEDEPNTPEFVGLMIRPGGGDPQNVERSTHWHILYQVDYVSPDENAQQIDWVSVTRADGQVDEYIAQARVTDPEDATRDLEAVKADATVRTVDCITCHNRVGHPIPNPRILTDADMTADRIDPTLPYIKREAMRLLWQGYPSTEVADQEIDKLSDFYELKYPEVYATKDAQITQAEEAIKHIYRLTSSPDMRVTAATYPNNLGHTDFPGCFRCHDGGHFLVKDGVVTNQTIPSTCDTCHTFPQLGEVASVPLGQPPATHDDGEWVFNHKDVATSKDPGGTTCGECHAKDYCDNCHATGAVNVDHDEMATNHAEAIRQSPTGAAACSYCHQEVYCARCHTEDMLPETRPGESTAAPATGWIGHPPALRRPSGLQWPLTGAVP